MNLLEQLAKKWGCGTWSVSTEEYETEPSAKFYPFEGVVEALNEALEWAAQQADKEGKIIGIGDGYTRATMVIAERIRGGKSEDP